MAAPQPATLTEMARQEISELHDFFVQWFRPAGDGVHLDLGRCRAALGADFRQVTPDGKLLPRDLLLTRLAQGRGCRPADFRIEIADIDLIWEADDAVLLVYTEKQYGQGLETQRRSTAFLTRSATAPCGVIWRHLQETWLQAPT
jgi:hypothetical protein